MSNTALQRHIDSAHGGQVKQDCPACIEIQARYAGQDTTQDRALVHKAVTTKK